jgi:DNA polymerase III subunit gamma/tau
VIEYIPKSINELIGNEPVKRSLTGLPLDKPILFEGETGVGKTLCAHLLAESFGASPENIMDINCVHFSKIEDIRSIIDDLKRTSLFGNKKVLILDELHELSQKSQQELLRPLETLNINVLVIGCTTTTQKLFQTVLDRFIRIRLKPLSLLESKDLLYRLYNQESFHLPKWKESLLLEKSNGNPRRLFSGLAKIINVDSEEDVQYLLDIPDIENAEVLDLLKILLSGLKWEILQKKLDSVLKTNSPENIRIGLMNLLASRLMSSYTKTYEERERIAELYEYLGKSSGYPDKANLIIAVYNAHSILRREKV